MSFRFSSFTQDAEYFAWFGPHDRCCVCAQCIQGRYLKYYCLRPLLGFLFYNLLTLDRSNWRPSERIKVRKYSFKINQKSPIICFHADKQWFWFPNNFRNERRRSDRASYLFYVLKKFYNHIQKCPINSVLNFKLQFLL